MTSRYSRFPSFIPASLDILQELAKEDETTCLNQTVFLDIKADKELVSKCSLESPPQGILSVMPTEPELGSEVAAAGARKLTPTRAVFDDLRTAHSSITSRTARLPICYDTKGHVNALDEEVGSIPLRTLEPKRTQHPPTRPAPAFLAQRRNAFTKINAHDKDNVSMFSNQSKVAYIRPSYEKPDTSSSIKQALSFSIHLKGDLKSDGEISNFTDEHQDTILSNKIKHLEESQGIEGGQISILQDEDEEVPITRPRNLTFHSQDFSKDSPSYDANLPAKSSQDTSMDPAVNLQYFNGGKTHEEEKSISHPALSYKSLSEDWSSLQESSTVGNIYNHYIQSDGIYLNGKEANKKDNLDAQDDKLQLRDSIPDDTPRPNPTRPIRSFSKVQLRPHGLQLPKQRSKAQAALKSQTRPISFTMSAIPPAISKINTKTMEVVAKPILHGEVNKDPFTSNDDLESPFEPRQKEYEHYTGKLSSKNPFKVQGASKMDNNNLGNITLEERAPLEREVSKALRRASEYSTWSSYSFNSSSSFLLDIDREDLEEGASSFIGTKLDSHYHNEPPHEKVGEGSCNGQKINMMEKQSFYETDAIPTDWIDYRGKNMIRVPVNQPEIPPCSVTEDYEGVVIALVEDRHCPVILSETDHTNDWETVGESVFGLELDRSRIIGNVNRAGSSLANNSDGGDSSFDLTEIDGFSSTDKIAHHPSDMGYSDNCRQYRRRSLKETSIPVFLPVFREHKVNGYMADSIRTRPPQNMLRSSPPPLDRSHTNPFRSPPPQVKTYHEPNQLPYEPPRTHRRGKTGRSTFGQEVDKANKLKDSKNAPFLTSQINWKASENLEEMMSAKEKRTSAWMDEFVEPGPAISMKILNPPRSLSPSPYDDDHAKSAVSPSETDSLPSEARLKCNAQYFADSQKRLGCSRQRSPIVKGPPGAFYRGIRALTSSRKSNHKCSEHTNKKQRLANKSLRPLSLLVNQRPLTPPESPYNDPYMKSRPNDFIYRSPLAPPMRRSWQNLYSKSHLKNMEDAAKHNGISELPIQQTCGLAESSVKLGGSRRRLFESPKLFIWRHESSAAADMSAERRKISITVLCLCNIFPPMLALYAIGRLDGIMGWWTGGEYSTFARRQKKWAFILGCGWVFVTVIAVIIAIISIVLKAR